MGGPLWITIDVHSWVESTKIRQLVGIITDHNGLNKHLHTIDIVTNSICERCNLEEETVEHSTQKYTEKVCDEQGLPSQNAN